MKTNRFITIVLFLFTLLATHASGPIILNDPEKIFTIDSSSAQIWDPFYKKETPLITTVFTNKNTNQSYWYSFQISNPQNEDIDWLIVSYNFSINEIDLIELLPNNEQYIERFRDTLSLTDRIIKHKQPVFKVSLKANETKKYLLRIKNNSSYNYVFAIYSPEKFASNFFTEYLIFGIFYGFMLFVFIYTFFYYVLFRENVILYYCLFILSQIIYMLYRDGTGLFLTPTYSEYADIIKTFARSGVGVFLLLYCYYYFHQSLNKAFKIIFYILIITRISFPILYSEALYNYTYHIELITFLFCTYWAMYSYKKANTDSIFMIVGLVLLTAGYLTYYVSLTIWSQISAAGFFALYYGVALECIFMTLALTERFKRIKLENASTQKMNHKLEEQVQNRTIQIQEKNELLEEKSDELNLFLYSASHDLKGPLKTIEGLCNIGLYENNSSNEEYKELFSLIKKKLTNLESNITDLNTYTKIQNESQILSIINFDTLHLSILERFVEHKGFTEISINFKNNLTTNFYSDNFAVKSIYQNIFENALKYRDKTRKLNLKIRILDKTSHIKIVFMDNGLGIPESILPKIFNMFYRGSTESKDDTGLGLYIVKKAIIKLGGAIQVDSIEGVGTTFEIILPRLN